MWPLIACRTCHVASLFCSPGMLTAPTLPPTLHILDNQCIFQMRVSLIQLSTIDLYYLYLQFQVLYGCHDMKTPTPHNKGLFPEQKLVPNMQSSRERMCRWRKSRKQELVLWEKVKPQAKCRFSQRASTAAQDLLEKNMRHQRCCCRTASYRVCCESLEFGHPFMRFSCLLANPKFL